MIDIDMESLYRTSSSPPDDPEGDESDSPRDDPENKLESVADRQ